MMKFQIIILISILLLSNIGFADVTVCLDNQTSQHNVSRVNNTDNSVLIDLSWNKTCNQNCSSTLNDCRWDEPYQMVYFLSIIIITFVLLVFGLWMAYNKPMFDFPIYAILSLMFILLGGMFDIFLWRYRTIFIVMVFVPLVFFLYSLRINIRGRRREKRGTGH